MSNENHMIINLLVRLIKRVSKYKKGNFAEPYMDNKNKMKSELDLSN